jgi:hypothetical protein
MMQGNYKNMFFLANRDQGAPQHIIFGKVERYLDDIFI